ncbi:hypothetical protein N9V83_00805 [Flavobacteriales bacterium]|nr:hypothetical protein [Flavobacteriales bacterium]
MMRSKRIKLGAVTAIGIGVLAALYQSDENKSQNDKGVKEQASQISLEIEKTENLESIKTSNIEEGFKWVTSRNTIVIIPEKSIVNKDGEIINGEIDLKIKEYDNAIEASLAQIDMEYDSSGVSYHFETGGMFELKALKNDKEVFIKEGSEITVLKGSDVLSKAFNSYYYDDKQKNWVYTGKNKQLRHVETERELVLKRPGDSLIVQKDFPLQLDFDVNDFPELVGLKDVLFYPVNIDSISLRRLKVTSWEEMKLRKKKSAYSLTLYRFKNKMTIDVVPSTHLDSLLEEVQKNLKKYKRISITELKYTSWRQEEDVLSLSIEKLNFSSRKKLTPSEFNEIASDVVNVFKIRKFGMWNSDAPNRLPKGAEITGIEFIYKSDTLTCPKVYYLSESSKSLMFKYYYGKTFQFDPKQENIVWFLVDDNGRVMLYYCLPKDFKFVKNYLVVKRKELEYGKYTNRSIEKILDL